MAGDFIRFKSMEGEVFVSKSSISSIKQLRTRYPKELVSDDSDKGVSVIDINFTYVEITLKELDVDGHNVTISVKSDLDTFIETYFK